MAKHNRLEEVPYRSSGIGGMPIVFFLSVYSGSAAPWPSAHQLSQSLLYHTLPSLCVASRACMVSRVADPGSGAFLTLGSGMSKKSRSGSGIRIRNEHSGSYLRELRTNFLGLLRYLNYLMRIWIWEPESFFFLGSGIRDGQNSDPGSGINIPDPQHRWMPNPADGERGLKDLDCRQKKLWACTGTPGK